MKEAEFRYTQGKPKGFRRSDLPNPVTREFCAECGTHVLTRAPGMPGVVLLKVGTLDDPSVFGKPQMVDLHLRQAALSPACRRACPPSSARRAE